MLRSSVRTILWASIVTLSFSSGTHSQDAPLIRQAESRPLDEKTGFRPYEMVWADRKPARPPLVNFNDLSGWTAECSGGADARLYPSYEQHVWNSPTAKLTYRGVDKNSTVTLRPPSPIPIPDGSDSITMWMHGNNWSWVPDPSTPQVTIGILVKDGDGQEHDVRLTRVRWKEWWLPHRKMDPSTVQDFQSGASFSGIRITNCANTENRDLFFENLTFYKESLQPIAFKPRPKRGIDPFPGQSPGPNIGPGRLPFPTREETILPSNQESRFENKVSENDDGTFRFSYKGDDAELEYVLHPGQKRLGWVDVVLNGEKVMTGLVGAGVELEESESFWRLLDASVEDDTVRLRWNHDTESHFRIWQKSLVVDVFCRGGNAKRLDYGRITGLSEHEFFALPYMNYSRHHLGVLGVRGTEPCFASIWMDWYRSNGSKPFARDEAAPDGFNLNGGMDYFARTDGVRNDLFERFFFTVSPIFEETLPTIANPPAKQGMLAGQRLWQESWGPANYENEMKRSRTLRAYGIEMLTQCNHEITWRDAGESFTFRDHAAPGRGGDEALRAYVDHQKSLGWRSGLYTNYCDFASVNGMWNEDWVMLDRNGEWVTAWPRCYSPKALAAVEADAIRAPRIRENFGSNAAYTDVHTSVSPWDRTDYDARVPGAASFATTFYAYGELLLHDQDVYDGHCWSEGNHQWLYSGLATGNYGLTYSQLRLWEYPYLPHFDLLKMHPLNVDMGVPWTARFFEGCEGWSDKERVVDSIDQFIAATIAYGHIGWLVEEGHGMRQTCRSYYMLQQLQSRYVMRAPEQILYGTESGLVSSSEALLNGQWREGRLYLRYPGGLHVWINGNKEDVWRVSAGEKTAALPPYGWLAFKGDDFFERSALVREHRVDVAASPAYVYVDGRGKMIEHDGIETSGAVAVRRDSNEKGLSIIAVDGVDRIGISEPSKRYARNDVRRVVRNVARAEDVMVQAFDVDGGALGSAKTERTNGGWIILPVPDAIRYEVTTP